MPVKIDLGRASGDCNNRRKHRLLIMSRRVGVGGPYRISGRYEKCGALPRPRWKINNTPSNSAFPPFWTQNLVTTVLFSASENIFRPKNFLQSPSSWNRPHMPPQIPDFPGSDDKGRRIQDELVGALKIGSKKLTDGPSIERCRYVLTSDNIEKLWWRTESFLSMDSGELRV